MIKERKTVMKKYYLQVTIDSNLDASTKAVQDCNKILHKNGYEPFEINLYKSGNKYIKKVHNFLAFNHLNKIDKGALLVVPHPLYVNKKYIDILEKVKQKKHIKLAFLIHDLDSLRKLFLNAQDDFEYMDHKMYDISDYIIAHNDCMIDYLVTQGVKREKIHNLHIFDYLCESNNTIKFDRSVSIAGNLDEKKSNYLAKLKDIKAVHFDLYGVHLNEDILASNITYHGAFPPDEINNQLYSGFGLVWDGSSIEKCDGNTGEYLKYNNPHKLSLYLVSGIPVVIWKEAAEAKFVEEHGLGITVNSLDELGEKFASLSEEEYFEMVKNVAVVSNRLKNGYYLTQAIKEIEEA